MISEIGSRWTSTSNIERSIASGFIPWLMVRFPCGSRSTTSTRKPCSLKATARFSVVVVFATPPFWLANTITLCNDFSSVAVCARTFGRGSRRMSPMWERLSRVQPLFLHPRLLRLPVAVIEVLEPGDPCPGRRILNRHTLVMETRLSCHDLSASVSSMEEARVLARLDRIDALDREGAAPGELLAELRGLLREAESWTREQRRPKSGNEEVVERLRTALVRDMIGM